MPSNTMFEMGNGEWRDTGTRGQGEGETRRRRIQLLQFRLSPCPLVPLSPLLLVSPLPIPHSPLFVRSLLSSASSRDVSPSGGGERGTNRSRRASKQPNRDLPV